MKSAALLFLRDVEPELYNDHPVAGQVLLVFTNRFVALWPDRREINGSQEFLRLEEFRMHPLWSAKMWQTMI